MKFIKYLAFDIRQGILRNPTLIWSSILISMVIFIDFIFRAHRYAADGIIRQFVSYGDYLFYLYGGMTEYIPEYGEVFSFPIVWIVVFLVIPFTLLNYPFKELAGNGRYILTRSTRRTFWWLSKCIWNMLGTFCYHGLLLLTGIVLCLIFGVEITGAVHTDFVKAALRVRPAEIRDFSELWMPTLLLPVCVSVSLNLMQMTLSIFIKPIYSFFCIAIVLIVSAYVLSPAGIGNYAMFLRQDWVLIENGVSVNTGYGISLLLILLAVIAGNIRFRFFDVLE